MKKLNLALLNKMEEDLTKKELSTVKAGLDACGDCGVECAGTILFSGYHEEMYYGKNDPGEWFADCGCSSVYNFWGLALS